MTAAERPRFAALRRALVIDAERGERAASGRSSSAGGAALGRPPALGGREDGQLEAAPEIGAGAFAGQPRGATRSCRRRRPSSSPVARPARRVDGDRRERRADLALMARHAPLLLPQHSSLRCCVLPLPRVSVSTHASSRRSRSVRAPRLDANRALEPAAERDRHALQSSTSRP